MTNIPSVPLDLHLSLHNPPDLSAPPPSLPCASLSHQRPPSNDHASTMASQSDSPRDEAAWSLCGHEARRAESLLGQRVPAWKGNHAA